MKQEMNKKKRASSACGIEIKGNWFRKFYFCLPSLLLLLFKFSLFSLFFIYFCVHQLNCVFIMADFCFPKLTQITLKKTLVACVYVCVCVQTFHYIFNFYCCKNTTQKVQNCKKNKSKFGNWFIEITTMTYLNRFPCCPLLYEIILCVFLYIIFMYCATYYMLLLSFILFGIICILTHNLRLNCSFVFSSARGVSFLLLFLFWAFHTV